MGVSLQHVLELYGRFVVIESSAVAPAKHGMTGLAISGDDHETVILSTVDYIECSLAVVARCGESHSHGLSLYAASRICLGSGSL